MTSAEMLMISARTVLLMLLLALGCQATVASDLSEGEANQVVVALHQQGIGATKDLAEGTSDEVRFVVQVAPDEVGPALAVMEANALPRHDAPGLNEVFGEGGLVPTATEERARYVSAIGGELAMSIETIDGVLDARVHVAIPDTRRVALDDDRPHPRASVLIKYRGARPPYDVAAVEELVAGAVQGMETEHVSVLGVPAGAAPERREANLVRVGPVTVTRGSATAFKGILGGALAVNVLLVVALVVVWRRRPTAVSEISADES